MFTTGGIKLQFAQASKTNPPVKLFHLLHNCDKFLTKKSNLDYFRFRVTHIMFPAVLFHIDWFLPKYSDLTREDYGFSSL